MTKPLEQNKIEGAARKPLRLLLVEDNPGDRYLILQILEHETPWDVRLVHESYLDRAQALLESEQFDIILLDLVLPDSDGQHTVEQVAALARNAPVIVLSGLNNEGTAIEAVLNGAQDYLVKGDFYSGALHRIIQYALARHSRDREQSQLAMTDELTGLYNRRAFMTMASQQLSLATRHDKELCLFYMDMDNMKGINDTWGHKTGDLAIRDAADILRDSFRDSDILARIGGDEFLALAPESPAAGISPIKDRISGKVQTFNEHNARPYILRLSVGGVHFDARHPCSLDELVHCADQRMYREKATGRRKHAYAPRTAKAAV